MTASEKEFLWEFVNVGGLFDRLEAKGLIETGPGGITHRRYGPNDNDVHYLNNGYRLTQKGRTRIMAIRETET